MGETSNDFRNIVAFKDDDAVRKALGRAADEIDRANTENQRLTRRVADIASFQSATQRNENKRLTTEVSRLKEIEAVAVEVFYLNGYHVGCMCANCLLKLILEEHSTILASDRKTLERMSAPVSSSQKEVGDGND